jgi:hypothetical protein
VKRRHFPIWRHQHLVCTNWFEVDCHAQLAVSEKTTFFQNGGLQHLVCTDWFKVDCHAQLAVSEKKTFFSNMAASAPGLHQLVRGGLPRSAGGK